MLVEPFLRFSLEGEGRSASSIVESENSTGLDRESYSALLLGESKLRQLILGRTSEEDEVDFAEEEDTELPTERDGLN